MKGVFPVDLERRQNDSLVLERLARMEEQLKQVSDIKQSIEQLNQTVLNLNTTYLTKHEGLAMQQLRDTEFKSLEERVNKLENTNLWVTRLVGGIIITSLLGLLIAQKI
jgi:hypothetical protein